MSSASAPSPSPPLFCETDPLSFSGAEEGRRERGGEAGSQQQFGTSGVARKGKEKRGNNDMGSVPPPKEKATLLPSYSAGLPPPPFHSVSLSQLSFGASSSSLFFPNGGVSLCLGACLEKEKKSRETFHLLLPLLFAGASSLSSSIFLCLHLFSFLLSHQAKEAETGRGRKSFFPATFLLLPDARKIFRLPASLMATDAECVRELKTCLDDKYRGGDPVHVRTPPIMQAARRDGGICLKS